jgi:hypothetical protein
LNEKFKILASLGRENEISVEHIMNLKIPIKVSKEIKVSIAIIMFKRSTKIVIWGNSKNL